MASELRDDWRASLTRGPCIIDFSTTLEGSADARPLRNNEFALHSPDNEKQARATPPEARSALVDASLNTLENATRERDGSKHTRWITLGLR